MKGTPLSDATKLSIKKNVAEAFCPTDDKWYAMKLRRGISFAGIKKLIGTDKPEETPETRLKF